jgi:hypothetical protein
MTDAATAAQWQAFLTPLASAVRNPPPPDGLRAFAALCAAALHDVPAACLTQREQIAVVRRFAFWPAVADLAEHFADEAKRVREDRHAARIASTAAPALPRPEPVDREAASRVLATLVGELRGTEPPPPRVRPAYLPRETIRAIGEARK